MDKIKIISVFGTRPEAIKMAPLVKVIENNPYIDSKVCVTGQHREMLDQVLNLFEITPDHDLNIMKKGQTLSDITIGTLSGLEEYLIEENADLLLVHGDTTTCFSSALAGFYNGIKIGHVEAGLRTYDKRQPFPEEINRVLAGHLCDMHFAPTEDTKEHLIKENIKENIFITGNTSVDSLKYTVKDGYEFEEKALNDIDYSKKLIVMTAHRRENLGAPLEEVCNSILEIVTNNEDIEVVYLVHLNPKVQDTARRILGNHKRIHLVNPINPFDMHNLISRAYLVLTDSGGLQEEVPALNKPVLVLRNTTERPEGLEAGTLKLVGTKKETIIKETELLLNNKDEYEKMVNAKNPYGDGYASERILDGILYYFGINKEKPKDFS